MTDKPDLIQEFLKGGRIGPAAEESARDSAMKDERPTPVEHKMAYNTMNNFGYVLATKMLVDNKRKVRFMYREESKGEDSGWRFFCGDEDQEYADNPANIDIYDIKTVLDIDRSIWPYLNAAPGTALERMNECDAFKASPGFGFNAEEA